MYLFFPAYLKFGAVDHKASPCLDRVSAVYPFPLIDYTPLAPPKKYYSLF